MKHPAKKSFQFKLRPGVELVVAVKDEACSRISVYQRIDSGVVEGFGWMYALDGDGMASEADEFIVHESLVHLVALEHPAPRHVLVLGGGDGGSARELLKHPSIESVLVAELDPDVVVAVGSYLSAGSFDDPRVVVEFGDAAATIRQCVQAQRIFDLILFDLTASDDPQCAHLHQAPFLRECAALLAPGGIVHVQMGSPFYQPEKLRGLYAQLRACFADLRPALIDVPFYGGPWLLMRARRDAVAAPSENVLRQRMLERRIEGLRYYNPELHLACATLPNYVRQLLA